MSEHLHHKLAVLHQNLLHGKLPRSLRWTDALELVEHLGKAVPHGTDEFTFLIGAERELFKRPHGSDLGIDEVSRLRKFLKAAGAEPVAANPVRPSRMVVVIDHHVAHVFQDLNGSRPPEDIAIKPYDPHHFHHHLVHRKEAHYQGDRVPDEASFYKEITAAVLGAEEIILIGHGVGKSSAVDALLDHLRTHHPDVAEHIKAVDRLDLSALTPPEIEALAQRQFAISE